MATTPLYPLTIHRIPLQTREDLQEALDQLCRPLAARYSAGQARLRVGATGSGCPDATAELEG
ncbi:hypothetical protein ABTN47_18610, partial [Acinetobacter baumannii]